MLQFESLIKILAAFTHALESEDRKLQRFSGTLVKCCECELCA